VLSAKTAACHLPPAAYKARHSSVSLGVRLRRGFGGFGSADRGELLRRRAGAALDERLHAPREDTAWHQNAMPAAETDKADVRPEPDDAPIRTATGMWLPQADNVINGNVE
jgi:hypothetical protein